MRALILNGNIGVALILSLWASQVYSTQSTFYVAPSSDATTCGDFSPCNTFSQYENCSFVGVPNVALVFLPGRHTAEGTRFVVEEVVSFTMVGDPISHTEISCTNFLRFEFTNVSQIAISNLTFSSCGIEVLSAESFELSTSVIQDHISLRSALYMEYTCRVAVRRCSFSRNYGSVSYDTGGAVGLRSGATELSVAIFTDNSFTNNTAGLTGGAIYVDTATITFTGTNVFTDNSAELLGGAVFVRSGSITFNGTSMFVRNCVRGNVGVGGGLIANNGSNVTFHGNSTFTGNIAAFAGGGMIFSLGATLTIKGDIMFVGNEAIFGGGLFVGRRASAEMRGRVVFKQCKAASGGAFAVLESNVNVIGNTTIVENYVVGIGSGILILNSNLSLSGITHLENNIAAIDGGGCYLSRSTLSLNGTIAITNNTAQFGLGGVMIFTEESTTVLLPQTAVNFTANTAARGGAVAVEDEASFAYCVTQAIRAYRITRCFLQFQISEQPNLPPRDVSLYFSSNYATEGGSDLYGGSIDICYLETTRDVSTSVEYFPNHIINSDNDLNVSSDPILVCLCEDSIPNCNILEHHKSVFPGGTMQLLAVAFGH